jgi:hypothetical protein
MSVIRMSAAAENGELVLRVPMASGEYDVQLVVTPKPAGNPARTPTPEELGWDPAFFRDVIGSIDDDTFFRHPQPPAPPAISFEDDE